MLTNQLLQESMREITWLKGEIQKLVANGVNTLTTQRKIDNYRKQIIQKESLMHVPQRSFLTIAKR
jgi:hypothetical protein